MDTIRRLSHGLLPGLGSGSGSAAAAAGPGDAATTGTTGTGTTTTTHGRPSLARDLVGSLKALGGAGTASEAKLDFRPKSAQGQGQGSKGPAPLDVTSGAAAEKKKLQSGGALVGEVEWIPDPAAQGGYRAVVKPSRKSAEGEAEATATTTSATKSPPPPPPPPVSAAQAWADAAASKPRPAMPPGRPSAAAARHPEDVLDEEDEPTPAALHAKAVIEAAIRAEQEALERVRAEGR